MPTVSAESWRRIGAVGIVLVAAVAVVITWARPAHEPAPPVAGSAPVAVTSLSPTDLAYLQLMISLDNSALPLLEQMRDVPAIATVPAVKAVATSAIEGHRAELVALRAALKNGGGVEDGSQHAGHDLPGMVLGTDLDAITAAPAAQQPAMAVQVLRDHLTGTTNLCTSEGTAGADPASKAAAAGVLDTHTKLLAQLPAM